MTADDLPNIDAEHPMPEMVFAGTYRQHVLDRAEVAQRLALRATTDRRKTYYLGVARAYRDMLDLLAASPNVDGDGGK